MFEKSVKNIIILAREEAINLGYYHVNSNHLLIALLQNENETLRLIPIDLQKFRKEITNGKKLDLDEISITPELQKIIKYSFIESKLHSKSEVSPIHLLLSMLRQKGSYAYKSLTSNGIEYNQFQEKLISIGEVQKDDYQEELSKKMFKPFYKTIYEIKFFIVSLFG